VRVTVHNCRTQSAHLLPAVCRARLKTCPVPSDWQLMYVRYMLSTVRLSIVCFVTFVRPTRAVQIFGNISTALGTLTIHWHPLKTSQKSSQGNPTAGGVKHKRGSQI